MHTETITGRAAHAAVRSSIIAAAITALGRIRTEAHPCDHLEAANAAPAIVVGEIDSALGDPAFRRQLAAALVASSISGGRP